MTYSTLPDLLIVLGKNIGVGSSVDDIRNHPEHASAESRLNVIAAGELYTPGMMILFSGGKTSGQDMPSEAATMKRYLLKLYPHIPLSDVMTEERSIDTAGNAAEVAKLITNLSFERIGLLSTGYHVKNAVTLFRRYGVPVDSMYSAEDYMRNPRYQSVYNQALQPSKVRQEKRREFIRTLLLATIDRRGMLLRQLTKRSRI